MSAASQNEMERLRIRIAELEQTLAKQAKAATRGMDAAKAAATQMEQNASRLYAVCGPQALESERAANAQLTTELGAALEREQALAAHVERLDNELQGKALTDDGVLADAYWHCADKITPWLGEETGPDTLINSVCGSLDFLIEQWREKKILEQERERRDLLQRADELETLAENMPMLSSMGAKEALRLRAAELRKQAEAQP